jgi:hypothetical protein
MGSGSKGIQPARHAPRLPDQERVGEPNGRYGALGIGCRYFVTEREVEGRSRTPTLDSAVVLSLESAGVPALAQLDRDVCAAQLWDEFPRLVLTRAVEKRARTTVVAPALRACGSCDSDTHPENAQCRHARENTANTAVLDTTLTSSHVLPPWFVGYLPPTPRPN